MKKLLLVLLYFAFVINSNSQTADKKWNIGFHGGITQYTGDLGKGFYSNNSPTYGFGGISFSRYLGNRLDVSALFTKGDLGYHNDSAGFHEQVTTATVNFRFNILGADAFLRPYIFVGGGALMFSKNISNDRASFDFAVPSFGAGLNIRMGQAVNFNFQETCMYSTNDARDGINNDGSNDAYLFHSVGLTFNFGNKKDADKDGVADRNDKCPDTPPNVKVDEKGCPLDQDKDGVADYIDDCPDVPGISTLKGCPDKDGDNIADKDDRCPDAAGTVEFKGCPDADKDGVVDIDDKCPDTKANYKVDATGCTLDNDKDGLVNEEDSCVDLAGPLALKGCPDTDGDGVADNVDRCPTVVGTIANKGCPEMTKEEVKRIIQIASKIYFEFNVAALKDISLPQLDELVVLLKKYDAANLTIEGHTDNVGDDAYNMTLSQARTESVKNYLMSKGIMESRLIAIGYGETKPISDNKTKAGRAQNRRVELKTSY